MLFDDGIGNQLNINNNMNVISLTLHADRHRAYIFQMKLHEIKTMYTNITHEHIYLFFFV